MGFSRNLFKKSSESFPFWNSALVTRHEPPVHGLLPCSLSLQICTFVFNRFHDGPPAISFFSNFCICARGCTPPNSKMHLPLHFSSPLRAIYLGALHPAQPRAEIPALPLSTFDFRPVSQPWAALLKRRRFDPAQGAFLLSHGSPNAVPVRCKGEHPVRSTRIFEWRHPLPAEPGCTDLCVDS